MITHVRLSDNTLRALSMHEKRLTQVNLRKDLSEQRRNLIVSEAGARVEGVSEVGNVVQTKNSMQDEAVAESVRVLGEHERSESARAAGRSGAG